MSTCTSLLAEVRACTLCEAHLPLGPRPVLQLHPKASVLIAGQAPGTKVHETGVPFDDPSGKRLREWMGVTREEFYDSQRIAIVPMGFCFPGSGKSGDLPPRPECAPAWREQLLEQLRDLQVTLVLGQYAQVYHFGGGSTSVTDRDEVLARPLAAHGSASTPQPQKQSLVATQPVVRKRAPSAPQGACVRSYCPLSSRSLILQ